MSISDGNNRSWEDLWAEFIRQRGIDDPEHCCPDCQGLGVKVYGSTATWRGGVGGQELTEGVCDKCWGSGDRYSLWPSHREFYQLRTRVDALARDLGRQENEINDVAATSLIQGAALTKNRVKVLEEVLRRIHSVARRTIDTDRYETTAGLYCLIAGIAAAAQKALGYSESPPEAGPTSADSSVNDRLVETAQRPMTEAEIARQRESWVRGQCPEAATTHLPPTIKVEPSCAACVGDVAYDGTCRECADYSNFYPREEATK